MLCSIHDALRRLVSLRLVLLDVLCGSDRGAVAPEPFPYEDGSALHDLAIVLTYLWPMVLQMELALRPLGVASAVFETAPLASVLAVHVDLQAQLQLFPVTWTQQWALRDVHSSQSSCAVKQDTEPGFTPPSSLACLVTTRASALTLLNSLFAPASQRSKPASSVPGRTDFIGHRATLPRGITSSDTASSGDAATLAAPAGSQLEAVCNQTHTLIWRKVQAACTTAAVTVGITGAGLSGLVAAGSVVSSSPRVAELDYDSEVDFSEETRARLQQGLTYLFEDSSEAAVSAGEHSDSDEAYSLHEPDSLILDASLHRDAVRLVPVPVVPHDSGDAPTAAGTPHAVPAVRPAKEFNELQIAALLHYKPLYDATAGVLLASKESACGDSPAVSALTTSLLAALIAYGLDAPRLASFAPRHHSKIYTEAALLSPDISVAATIEQAYGTGSSISVLGGAANREAAQLYTSLMQTVIEVRKALFQEFWVDDNSDDSLQDDDAAMAFTSASWHASPLFASPAAVTAVSLTKHCNPMKLFEQRFQTTSLRRCLPTIQLIREDGVCELVEDVSCMAAFDEGAMVQSLTWNVRYD